MDSVFSYGCGLLWVMLEVLWNNILQTFQELRDKVFFFFAFASTFMGGANWYSLFKWVWSGILSVLYSFFFFFFCFKFVSRDKKITVYLESQKNMFFIHLLLTGDLQCFFPVPFLKILSLFRYLKQKKYSFFQKCRWLEKSSFRQLKKFFNQFSRDILFFCFVCFFVFFFCLFVCFLKLKKNILIHIWLCRQVSDKKIFNRLISGNKTTFFWPDGGKYML